MFERVLPQRSEERVVDRYRDALAGLRVPIGDPAGHGDGEEIVGRVGGCFHQDRSEASAAHHRVEFGVDVTFRHRGFPLDRSHAELGQDVVHEMVGPAVEGSGVEQHVSRVERMQGSSS